MACEPCIRGHRSTKCTHANERLMVPVRKPGRPLSSCPHPSSKPCACSQVTAAIPRKQKCSCGEGSTTTPPTTTTTTAPATEARLEEESTSPTSNGNGGGYRVSKSRRASAVVRNFNPSGMEKMDAAGQLNLVSAGGSQQMTPMTSAPGTPLGTLPMQQYFDMPGLETNGYSAAYTVHPQRMMPVPANGTPSTTNGSAMSKAPAAKGSCCGGSKEEAVESESPAPTPSTTSSSSPRIKSNGDRAGSTKGCCSSKATPAAQTPAAIPMAQTPMGHPGIMIPTFPQAMGMPNGMYPFFAHPGIFTYPPQYGTFGHPLQPDQWRQMMAHGFVGQPMAVNGFTMPAQPSTAPAPYPQTTNIAQTHQQDATPSVPGTSHHCSCGSDCSCIGCAAHPYNEATQEYVRSAWSTMLNEQQQQQQPPQQEVQSNGHTPQNEANQNDSNGTGPHTPSDAASALSAEEQTLSADDFFFVSYPFGDPCAGDGTSCACVEDCQCMPPLPWSPIDLPSASPEPPPAAPRK